MVFAESPELSSQHICYSYVQMLLHHSTEESIFDELIERSRIVEALLEEETIEEASFPKLERINL